MEEMALKVAAPLGHRVEAEALSVIVVIIYLEEVVGIWCLTVGLYF